MSQSNVIALPATSTMTVEQALASAHQLDLEHCLVVGYDRAGDLAIRSSRMSRQDALWLMDQLKHHILHAE